MADLLLAALVVCDGPDPSPHVPWVVMPEVILNPLFVPVLSQLDALF